MRGCLGSSVAYTEEYMEVDTQGVNDIETEVYARFRSDLETLKEEQAQLLREYQAALEAKKVARVRERLAKHHQ